MKKLLIPLLLVVLVTTLLIGCSDDETKNTSTPEKSATAKDTATAKATVIASDLISLVPENVNMIAYLDAYAVLKDKDGPIFLHDLDPSRGDYSAEHDIECGIFCHMAQGEYQ